MLWHFIYVDLTSTLEIKNDTLRLLEKLKNEMGLENYDDVISRLIKKEAGLPESLFGVCKGSKSFKREAC